MSTKPGPMKANPSIDAPGHPGPRYKAGMLACSKAGGMNEMRARDVADPVSCYVLECFGSVVLWHMCFLVMFECLLCLVSHLT